MPRRVVLCSASLPRRSVITPVYRPYLDKISSKNF
jgi:hypothetical protein